MTTTYRGAFELRPVASAARLVRAALRGAGTDSNGKRLPGCHPGAAFGPFLTGRNHDP
jgi:hypothetical protein